jgi:hypothetical protein
VSGPRSSALQACSQVWLCCAGVPLSFAEVQEAVRLTRQTAIGYIRGSGGSPAAIKANEKKQRRQAVLGCSASHRVTFGEADRIVAIALVSSWECLYDVGFVVEQAGEPQPSYARLSPPQAQGPAVPGHWMDAFSMLRNARCMSANRTSCCFCCRTTMSEAFAEGWECLEQQLTLTACHLPVTRLNVQLSFSTCPSCTKAAAVYAADCKTRVSTYSRSHGDVPCLRNAR